MIEINNARKIRAKLAAAANYFLANKDILEASGDHLEWSDFETLPEWYMWDEKSLNHLMLVAGTIFLLPSIRLWIEVKRVNYIKNLIGKETYEFIMQYTHLEHSSETMIKVDDLNTLIKTAGASVIISSQDNRLHPWLTSQLPLPKGLIKKKVAIELMNHALFVLEQTATKPNNNGTNENIVLNT